MIRAIYPGSFDPVTLGHLDIIKRSAEKVDELIIGVLNNNQKNPMFTVEERVEMLIELTKDYSNVKVEAFTGLSAEFVKRKNANVISSASTTTDTRINIFFFTLRTSHHR